MAGLWRHGAEGVSTAGGEGVQADKQHVHQEGPGVALRQEVLGGAEKAEPPQEVPVGMDGFVFNHQQPTNNCFLNWFTTMTI